jgi:hypothetical protein
MTTETIQPQPESGPASDNGQVQSQGHRRRRRRRKNKSGQQNAQQQPQQPQMQQPPPAQPKPASQHQHQHQNHHQGQHQGRKKKKFFQKPQPQASQPGNSVAPHHQAKRKGKQKGPREFVGPMDHSYRAANGNVADGPPSTIQLMGGNYGNYMESFAPPPPPAAVPHGAPTRIFCFIEDLFLQAKIQENARKLGVKVEFIKGDKDVVSRLTEVPEPERPTLLVFDLNNLNAKPMALIPKLKAKLKKATSIIGFLHHLQGDLKIKAIEAGCDTVMPRSAFSQSLPNLLRRYGIAEEEEDYAQQPM